MGGERTEGAESGMDEEREVKGGESWGREAKVCEGKRDANR